MRYVIDTSVLAKVFLDEDGREQAVALLAAAARSEHDLHMPSLIMYELNNVLVRRGVSNKSYDDAIRFVHAWLKSSVLILHEFDETLMRASHAIALTDTRGQGHISSFDATFHALAIRIDAEFVTADEAYVRKTQSTIGKIRHLATMGH